jgi:hypothetical protein
MNTASRMESTGVSGKIHISTAVQERLVIANKNWAVPREDKVIAKGKGRMDTYWLQISASSSDGARSSDGQITDGSNSELFLSPNSHVESKLK